LIQSLKSAVRDAIPLRLQVPIKYWYGLARGQSEAEMALLPDLVMRGSHVADIGGNRGIYAYRLWKLGAKLEVFEPNPDCARVLRSWASGADGVAIHPVALSSEQGSATLHVPVDEAGVEHDSSASIEAVEEGTYRDIEVPLRSLDSFGFADLDFIKIDTEGHEMSVIEGAKSTIQSSQPAMLIEIEQRHNRKTPISVIFEHITGLGYRGFFLRGRQLVPLGQFDVERDQSLHSFEANDGRYLNNFLFLSAIRLQAGNYRSLTARWMPE
jgi:FkbM family methyltransferase